MAKTIPQLTDATTVNAADETIIQQGGITKRATAAELAKGLNAINGMVNIKDFGAVGDGVADDLAAFTAANNSGGLVYIPKPSVAYNVSAPIKMDKCACLLDPSASWAALTDSGNINYLRALRSEPLWVTPIQANYWRLTDRVLVGGMANKWDGSLANNTGSHWFADTSNFPGYLGVNGKIVVSTSTDTATGFDNPYGICAGVRSSDAGDSVIGFGSCVINDKSTENGWGFIAEIERRTGAVGTYGLEVAAKNKGSNVVATPNDVYGGIYGLWCAGGGDPAFGGAPTAPSTAGVVILKGSHATGSWNTGIMFAHDALTNGEAIALSSRSSPTPHGIRWYNDSQITGDIFCSNVTNGTRTRIEIAASTIGFLNNAGLPFFIAVSNATSATRVQINSTSASALHIDAVGASGSDIDVSLRPQNSGNVRFGTHTATSDTAISGFITIKDSSGNSRKLAVIT